MNLIDEIELEFLEQTGDLVLAEAAGAAVRDNLECAAYMFGISVEEFLGYIGGGA